MAFHITRTPRLLSTLEQGSYSSLVAPQQALQGCGHAILSSGHDEVSCSHQQQEREPSSLLHPRFYNLQAVNRSHLNLSRISSIFQNIDPPSFALVSNAPTTAAAAAAAAAAAPAAIVQAFKEEARPLIQAIAGLSNLAEWPRLLMARNLRKEPEPFEGEMDDDDYVEGEFEDLDDSVFLDGDEDLDLDLIPGDFDIGLDEGDRQADPS